jgi:zinc transport system ATP-binding protein
MVVFEGVTFAYEDIPIVEDVCFTIADRQFISIVGPNGGGKTTLLKLMLGLLQPTRGRIEVCGQTPVKARPCIGYMPQHLQFDPQFPVSVLDVVLMGRLGNGTRIGPYRRSDIEVAREALQRLEMDGLRSRPFPALSGDSGSGSSSPVPWPRRRSCFSWTSYGQCGSRCGIGVVRAASRPESIHFGGGRQP